VFCSLHNVVSTTPPPSLQQLVVDNVMDCNQLFWHKSEGDGIVFYVNKPGILNLFLIQSDLYLNIAYQKRRFSALSLQQLFDSLWPLTLLILIRFLYIAMKPSYTPTIKAQNRFVLFCDLRLLFWI